MKRIRAFVVLLLSFAVPFVASAGVRMQLTMDQAFLHTAAMSDMSMSSEDVVCDMAGDHTGTPEKSMSCCQGKSCQDCQICNLPASATQSLTSHFPQSFSQFVDISTALARLPDQISGTWRPPRQS